MQILILALEFIGTFAFAISGAVLGVRYRLDLFGVLVLSFAAATSGGIVRDVLIGSTPPAALGDWRYLGVSCLAGLLAFYRNALVERLRNAVQLFDAAGLALFAVSGASKAMAFGLGPVSADVAGHSQRHRRRHRPRHPGRAYASGAASRSVRGRGHGRRRRGRHRPAAALACRRPLRSPARCCASACASWRSATAGACRWRGRASG